MTQFLLKGAVEIQKKTEGKKWYKIGVRLFFKNSALYPVIHYNIMIQDPFILTHSTEWWILTKKNCILYGLTGPILW